MVQGALDNINLFSIITIMSFILLAPFTLAIEGFQLTHSGLTALGVVDTNFIFQQALYAALSFHMYQQVSLLHLSCPPFRFCLHVYSGTKDIVLTPLETPRCRI